MEVMFFKGDTSKDTGRYETAKPIIRFLVFVASYNYCYLLHKKSQSSKSSTDCLVGSCIPCPQVGILVFLKSRKKLLLACSLQLRDTSKKSSNHNIV